MNAPRELTQAASTLARFRADPWRVRVSIAPDPKGWRATVQGRVPTVRKFVRVAKTARMAVILALCAADQEIPGVDLSMSWAYDHPQKTARHRSTS